MELLRALVEAVLPSSLQALVAEYGNLPDGAQENRTSRGITPSRGRDFSTTSQGVELYGPDDCWDPNRKISYSSRPRLSSTFRSAICVARRPQTSGSPRCGIYWRGPLRKLRMWVSWQSIPGTDRTVVRASVDQDVLGTPARPPPTSNQCARPLQAAVSQEQLTRFTAPEQLPEPSDTPIGVVDGVVVTTNPMVGPYVVDANSFPAVGADDHGTERRRTRHLGDLDVALGGTLPDPYPVVSARVLEPRVGAAGDVRVQVASQLRT